MPADKLFGKDVVLTGNPMNLAQQPAQTTPPSVCPTCGRPDVKPKASTAT